MKTVNLFAVSLLFVILVVFILHAQPHQVEWDRIYGGNWDYDMTTSG